MIVSKASKVWTKIFAETQRLIDRHEKRKKQKDFIIGYLKRLGFLYVIKYYWIFLYAFHYFITFRSRGN